MSRCHVCDFPAKASYAEEWYIPYEICSKSCYDLLNDEPEKEKVKMFKIRIQFILRTEAIGGCSTDIHLFRDVDIPFVPFVGLEISDGSNLDCEITKCWYELDKDIFHAITHDEEEIQNAKRRGVPHRSIEEVTQEYTSYGWSVYK